MTFRMVLAALAACFAMCGAAQAQTAAGNFTNATTASGRSLLCPQSGVAGSTQLCTPGQVVAAALPAALAGPPPIGATTPNTGAFSTVTSPVINKTFYIYPTAGIDLADMISAAMTSMPSFTTANGPTKYGHIEIGPNPSGSTIDYAKPIVINSPMVSLGCDGQAGLHYTGTGVAITIGDSPTSYTGWGEFNCRLFGTSAAAAGIKLIEPSFFTVHNARVSGFTGPGAIALWYQNQASGKWTEQTTVRDSEIDNNTVAVLFENVAGNTVGGFAYTTFDNVNISVPAGADGFIGRGSAFLNGVFDNLKFFLADGSYAAHWKDTFSAGQGGNTKWFIRGELAGGATHANGVVVDATAQYQVEENRWWNTPGITDSLSAPGVANYLICNYNSGACIRANGTGNIEFNVYGAYWAKLGFFNLSANRDFEFPDHDGQVAVANSSNDITFHNITATAITSSTITASGQVSAGSIVSSGTIAAGGVLTSPNIQATGAMYLFPASPGASSSASVSLTGQYNVGGVKTNNYLTTDIDGRWVTFNPVKAPGFQDTLNVKVSDLIAAYPCNSANKGLHAAVNDASSPTWNATLAGTGTVTTTLTPAFCNGASWVFGRNEAPPPANDTLPEGVDWRLLG